MLLELIDISCSVANGVGQTALHVACLWGNIEAAQALVDAKADLNAQNNFSGASPLHCAATENSRCDNYFLVVREKVNSTTAHHEYPKITFAVFEIHLQ